MRTTSQHMSVAQRAAVLGLLVGALVACAGVKTKSVPPGVPPPEAGAEANGDEENAAERYRYAEEQYARAMDIAKARGASQDDINRIFLKWHLAKTKADTIIKDQIPVSRVLREAARRSEEGDHAAARRLVELRLAQDQPRMLPPEQHQRLNEALLLYARLADLAGTDAPAEPVDPRRRGIELRIAEVRAQDLGAALAQGGDTAAHASAEAEGVWHDALDFSPDFSAYVARVRLVGLSVRLADYRPRGAPIETAAIADSMQQHCSRFGLTIEPGAGHGHLAAVGRVAREDDGRVSSQTELVFSADGARHAFAASWTTIAPGPTEAAIAAELGAHWCGRLVPELLAQFNRF